jgi:aminopeptidase N
MKDETTPEKFMATWLQQMNYPKVDVSLTRTETASKITFTQSRFLITPFADGPNPTYVSPFK